MYIEAINSIHDSATSTRSIKVVVNTTYNETANLALAVTSSSAASDHIDWIGLFTSIGVVVVAIGELLRCSVQPLVPQSVPPASVEF